MKKSNYISKSRKYLLLTIIASILFIISMLHIATKKDNLNKELDNYEMLFYDVNGIRFLTHGVNNLAINIKEYVVTGDSEYLRKYNKEIYIDKNREKVIDSLCENEALSSACSSLGIAMSYSQELLRYELHAIEDMKMGNQQAAINIIFSENYMNFVDKIYENVDKFKNESLNIIDYEINEVRQTISIYWYSSTFIIFLYVLSMLLIADRVYRYQKKSIKKMLKDPITGLGNTQAMLENYTNVNNLNCLVIDLINFNFINQTYGFKNGDNTLTQISKRIRKHFSKNSIYKISGSRFVVLTKKKVTGELLQSLISLINMPTKNNLKNGKIEINSTIGVALKSLNVDSINRLIDIASAASVSTRNKNSYTFASDETIVKFTERGSLIDKLDSSIVNGTMFPYYQLIIDPHNEVVVGMESTARWNKDGEILTQCEFYEFSKEVGLVYDIDITIFHQAIRDLALLREQDLVTNDFFVSVRLSCFSLIRLNETEVLNLLESFSLSPNNIQIEFTNEVFKSNELTSILNNLSEIGFRIVIDNIDFNLARINDFININVGIKDILKYSLSKNRIFYELLLDLTDKLNLCVYVKGIEKTNELKTALNFKNVHVQGLYFSKPVEIGQLVTML